MYWAGVELYLVFQELEPDSSNLGLRSDLVQPLAKGFQLLPGDFGHVGTSSKSVSKLFLNGILVKMLQHLFSPSSMLRHNRRYDTLHNDIQHNDTRHNEIQHTDTRNNDIQHK
jgi:hypothetical protein